MKKLITLILVLSTWNSFAQLTLYKNTDKNLQPFLLSNGEWMLFANEYFPNQRNIKNIIIYKNDLSIYKTIDISKISFDTLGYSYNEIDLNNINILGDNSGKDFYLTDHFFNSDNKIEFIIECYSMKKINEVNFYKETSLIINEDGIIIEKFENLLGGISFSFWKFLNVSYMNNSKNKEPYQTKMYTIPGNLPCPSSCNQKPASISPIDPSNAVNKLSIEGFPNPTSEKITLAYTLPKGSSYGTIRLYSQSGTLVKEFKVSDQFDHLELPVTDYAAGTYFYELQVDGNSSGGKKMLVVH
jgi:hypothetical protein